MNVYQFGYSIPQFIFQTLEQTYLPSAKRRNNLFIILCSVVLTNAIVAEIIGVKIFSAESVLNVPPAQISLMGSFVLDFNLTAGVIIWPIVFITSDLINEYFGRAGVKKISLITAIFIVYAFIAIYVATVLPPAQFWLDVNPTDGSGNAFNINAAFAKIFRQGLRIIIGSIAAFLIGQLLDAYVFHSLRRLTGSKKLWLRATGSTLVSQLIDSFVVLFVAFYNPWTIEQVLAVGVINYIYKFSVAILLTPFLYLAHYIIDSYLGKEKSDHLIEQVGKI